MEIIKCTCPSKRTYRQPWGRICLKDKTPSQPVQLQKILQLVPVIAQTAMHTMYEQPRGSDKYNHANCRSAHLLGLTRELPLTGSRYYSRDFGKWEAQANRSARPSPCSVLCEHSETMLECWNARLMLQGLRSATQLIRSPKTRMFHATV